jgi:hypothetical protein
VNREPIVAACLAGLLCLAPLAVYLLWVAVIARRDRPTVVSGTWDLAGLVAGLSGFILFGGGIVLFLLQSGFRYWMRGNFESFRHAWGNEKYTWIMLSAIYLFAVIGAVALAAAARRRSLVVYNIDPAEFEATVAEVFEHLSRPVERRGDRWTAGGTPLFELDRFEAGKTVTLRWLSPDRLLFQEVERLLREALGDIRSGDNPASRWVMACAGGAAFWAACSFALLMVFVFSSR